MNDPDFQQFVKWMAIIITGLLLAGIAKAFYDIIVIPALEFTSAFIIGPFLIALFGLVGFFFYVIVFGVLWEIFQHSQYKRDLEKDPKMMKAVVHANFDELYSTTLGLDLPKKIQQQQADIVLSSQSAINTIIIHINNLARQANFNVIEAPTALILLGKIKNSLEETKNIQYLAQGLSHRFPLLANAYSLHFRELPTDNGPNNRRFMAIVRKRLKLLDDSDNSAQEAEKHKLTPRTDGNTFMAILKHIENKLIRLEKLIEDLELAEANGRCPNVLNNQRLQESLKALDRLPLKDHASIFERKLSAIYPEEIADHPQSVSTLQNIAIQIIEVTQAEIVPHAIKDVTNQINGLIDEFNKKRHELTKQLEDAEIEERDYHYQVSVLDAHLKRNIELIAPGLSREVAKKSSRFSEPLGRREPHKEPEFTRPEDAETVDQPEREKTNNINPDTY